MDIDLRTERRHKKPESSLLVQLHFIEDALLSPWQQPLLSLLILFMCTALLTVFFLIQRVEENLPLVNQAFFQDHKTVLFLKTGLDSNDVRVLQHKLKQRNEIQAVISVSPEEGLNQLEKKLQMGNKILGYLSENPLPNVLKLVFKADGLSLSQIISFLDELKNLPEVTTVQSDLKVIKHFYEQKNQWSSIFMYVKIFLFIFCTILMADYWLLVLKHDWIVLFYASSFYGLLCGFLAYVVLINWITLLISKLTSILGWPIALSEIDRFYLLRQGLSIGCAAAFLSVLLTFCDLSSKSVTR